MSSAQTPTTATKAATTATTEKESGWLIDYYENGNGDIRRIGYVTNEYLKNVCLGEKSGSGMLWNAHEKEDMKEWREDIKKRAERLADTDNQHPRHLQGKTPLTDHDLNWVDGGFITTGLYETLKRQRHNIEVELKNQGFYQKLRTRTSGEQVAGLPAVLSFGD